MITILKTGYGKIMRLFHQDRAARLHLREIARKANLHEPSASRCLDSLEKEGLLKSGRDGNQKKYWIKRGYRAHEIFQMFDMERLHALPSIRKNAIMYFLGALQEKPVAALVFGSTAKGTFHANSDVDLLLITNRRIDTKAAEREADALTAIKVSPLQITLSAFRKELKMREDMVVQSAISTGYPVANHLYYYEVTQNEHQKPE